MGQRERDDKKIRKEGEPMADNYCGKTCEGCRSRAADCPGCKAGPGALGPEMCELARCCRDRGHETCGTCPQRSVCGLWNCREEMPERRRRQRAFEERKLAEREARKRALVGDAAELARWLRPLFWLIVPGTIAGLLSGDGLLAPYLPALVLPGEILSVVCDLAYGLILLRLAGVERTYRAAGICSMIGAAGGCLAELLAGGAGWSLLILLPVAVVALAGECQEYVSHAEALEPLDLELSQKWRRLWKWYIGAYLGTIFGMLAMLLLSWASFLALLAALVSAASAVALPVLAVVKLVYLWRAGRAAREYAAGDPVGI